MDIKILNNNNSELELQIIGETHTLVNIIKSELLKDNRVEIAYYDLKSLSNSLSKEPTLYITTYNNIVPMEVLKDTLNKIENICNDFEDSFKKEFIIYKNKSK